MLRIQSDEKIIEKLYSYLEKIFNPKLRFEIKKPLRELFPKPENKWLLSIWQYGHADISVYRHNKLVAIVEPGGWHYHLKDKKQMLRDQKKDSLCKINGVNILRVLNDIVNHLDLLKTKRLFKKHFYGKF